MQASRMFRTLATVVVLFVSGCATSSSASRDGTDCSATCASQRDACVAKAGPVATSGDPHQQVSKEEWQKQVAQQQAASACTDGYNSCSSSCH